MLWHSHSNVYAAVYMAQLPLTYTGMSPSTPKDSFTTLSSNFLELSIYNFEQVYPVLM
jgi:hypothetical protein